MIVNNLEYFLLYYKLNNNKKYLIWFTDENGNIKDGVISSKNKIISFKTKELAIIYSDKFKFNLYNKNDKEIGLHDFDIIKKFNVNSSKSLNIYHYLLIAWNIFNDFCQSLNVKKTNEFVSLMYENKKRSYKHISKIYDKVFWANNLDVLTPEGRFYAPIWKKSEIKMLKRIIKYGLEIFENNIIEISSEEDLKKIFLSNDK